MPEIDLGPDEHRPVYDKPLSKPGPLKRALVSVLIVEAVCLWGAFERGGFWVFPPALVAVYIGIAWAGLNPGYWFRER